MKGWICCLATTHLLGQAPVPPEREVPAPAVQGGAPEPRPETKRERISRRNLFHPMRGLLPQGGGADGSGTEGGLPSLVGTLVTQHHQSALLLFPGQAEAVVMVVGEEREGVVLKKIAPNKVQVVLAAGGEPRWLDLDQDRQVNGAASELGTLFTLNKPRALEPPPRPSASIPPKPPRSTP